MSIGVRLKPRASEASIRAMVEAAGGVYEPPRKTKRAPKPEDVLHRAVVMYLRRAIGHEGVTNDAGVMWWSWESRNVGKNMVTKSGRTINLEALNRKARGCIAGLPDIIVLCRGRFLGIELKAGSAVSPAQKELHKNIIAAGGYVDIDLTVENVQRSLQLWGCPLRASVSA